MLFYNLFVGGDNMAREYEIVSRSQLRYMNIFLVRLISRTAHLHQEMELGMILEGSVTLHTGQTHVRLSPGDIYMVSSLSAHSFLSEGPGALVLSVQLAPRYFAAFLPELQKLRYTGSPKLCQHFSKDSRQYALLSCLLIETAYAYLQRQADFEYRCFSLMARIFQLIKENLGESLSFREEDQPGKEKTQRLLSITDYIEENYTHKILLEDIARREGLSMTYLSHLFKDSLGVSFQDYVKEKRFEYACGLIAGTQRKILDISVSSGFSDVRYLTRMFHERFGCTPREYRKSAQIPSRKQPSPLHSSQYFMTAQDSLQLLAPLREQSLQSIGEYPLRSFL